MAIEKVARALMASLLDAPDQHLTISNMSWSHFSQDVSLEDLKVRFSHIFNIDGAGNPTDPLNRYEVELNIELTLCLSFCSKSGCETPAGCEGLHCCKFFLNMNKCKFGSKCEYGHNLKNKHNAGLLKRYLLDGIAPQQLGKLLRRDGPSNTPTPDVGTTPTVCTFYNNASGCRHGDTKRCHSLHVCKYFLLSGCNFGDKCNRSHNIYDRQPKGVLKSLGVDVKEPVDVVLEELKLIMKRENPRDDDDSESSSSDSDDSAAESPTAGDVISIKVCKFYNVKTGCRSKSKCKDLHMCKHFLMEDCTMSDTCPRSHDVMDPLHQALLSKVGMDIGESRESILEELKAKLKQLARMDEVNEQVDNPEDDDRTKLFNLFYRSPEVRAMAGDKGLDDKMFRKAFLDFRRACVSLTRSLSAEFEALISHLLLCEDGNGIDELFLYFIQHTETLYPHINCVEDLKQLSDLRSPELWDVYKETREMKRNIIYHAGPTNSGKTYNALERLRNAKSGMYCGPLKLLAAEVFDKFNAEGTSCDLITGDDKRFVKSPGSPSAHVTCTVEMTNLRKIYEVAVIDEIQMIRDEQRGWAWTRALLGVRAHEVHLCGEASTVDLVKKLASLTGDSIKVITYERKTKLTILEAAVESFENIEAGDCIVCFSKKDIYDISRQLDQLRKKVAVIYGTLPPSTKLAQAEKFNNPRSGYNVLVATDAIGMGLNLNIRRIVFYSLVKPCRKENGEKEKETISASAALQIAGRAGRFKSRYEEGFVTTFKGSDLPLLHVLLKTPIIPVQQAGLHPTAEQVEMFCHHLPQGTALSDVIDIFVSVSCVDENYFLCGFDDFKIQANIIRNIPLKNVHTRYLLCCAPLLNKPFVYAMFSKFARQLCNGRPVSVDWFKKQIGWPLREPLTIENMMHLEQVFDVFNLYRWLSYRFTDMFPNTNVIIKMQTKVDDLIADGIRNITTLVSNSEMNNARHN